MMDREAQEAQAKKIKENQKKEDEFLEKIFRGAIHAFNVNENSIEIKIYKEKVGLIDFDLNLWLFEKGQKGRKNLEDTFELFFNDKTVITLHFINCVFQERVYANQPIQSNLTFENCLFEKSLDVTNITLGGKIRFKACTLHGIDFNNTVFTDLLDFWNCLFKVKIIFYKTDFLGSTTFAASTFCENVLFTYTLIEKHLILNGAKFKKGLDLSLALKPGSFDFFDIALKNYPSEDLDKNIEGYEGTYESCVTEGGSIPTKNKRETFCLIKQTLEKQANVYESIHFKTIEKDILRHELLIKWKPIKALRKGNEIYISDQISILFDQVNLWLNSVSSRHGKSYTRAFIFTAIAGWLFFYFSLLATDLYSFSFIPSEWHFENGFKLYIQFLLPTHSFEYLGKGVELSGGFYFFDFLGRIFVGYGIYQFIQAFRKFR